MNIADLFYLGDGFFDVMGIIGVWYVASLWLEQFSEKTMLSPFVFIGGASVVMAIIFCVVCIGSYRVAGSNPVDYLKNE